jgi:hypothetical protein
MEGASGRFASHKGKRGLIHDGSYPLIGEVEKNRQLGNDYLTELHEKNKSIGNKNNAMVEQYMKDKNLNEYQKLEAVKRQANLIEERARMKEKLMDVERKEYLQKYNSDYYKNNVDKTIEVNDMYIDAINAKLKILDQI